MSALNLKKSALYNSSSHLTLLFVSKVDPAHFMYLSMKPGSNCIISSVRCSVGKFVLRSWKKKTLSFDTASIITARSPLNKFHLDLNDQLQHKSSFSNHRSRWEIYIVGLYETRKKSTALNLKTNWAQWETELDVIHFICGKQFFTIWLAKDVASKKL